MTTARKEKTGFRTINRFLLIGGVFLLLLIIAFHQEINSWLGVVFDIFSPVILGLVLAYMLNPIFCFLERRVFYRVYPSAARRGISLLLTYIFSLLMIGLIVLLILPQLITTLMDFVANYNEHFNGAIDAINSVIRSLNQTLAGFFNVDTLFGYIDGNAVTPLLDSLIEQLIAEIPTLTDKAGDLVSGAADVIFAIFISVYLLSSKEKRYAQVMKLRTALFNDKINQRITGICTTANNLFGKFVEARLLDSLIVGVLTYIVLVIFQIPHALLIASSTAVWNVIPTVGFLIGYFPAAAIILLSDASLLFPFTLLMFIIYQVDSNIISPRISGYNTGVSSLCVIIAICTMGTMFGIVGLIISVPLFATLLNLFDDYVHNRLRHKRLPDDAENYYAPDSPIDYLHMSKTGLGRWVTRIEKRALHLNNLIAGGHEKKLKKRDKRFLNSYRRARKLNLLSDAPPDVLTQFSAESAERGMREESEKRYRSMLEEHRSLAWDEKDAPITTTEAGGEEA